MSQSGKVINEGKGHKIEGNYNLDKYTSPSYICIVGKKRKCLKENYLMLEVVTHA